MATLKNTTFANLILPSGSTAERPGSPVNGMMRYNSTMNLLEHYRDGQWQPITGISKGTVGSGGQEIRFSGASGNRASNGIVHMFTSVGNHTFVPTFTGTVEVLIVAGGGSGGTHWGGGGGGGGIIYNRAYPVSAGSSYPLTVGAGAAAATYPNRGNEGGSSAFNGVTATGGGGGGSWDGNGQRPGGSGGGGANGSGQGSRFRYEGGDGISGQGFPGGSGVRFNQQGDNTHFSGSGGGAGGPGISGSENAHDGIVNDGGPGAASDILGEVFYWGGGGSGCAHLGNGRRGPAGGVGGGGGSNWYHGGPRHPGSQHYGIGGGQALNNGQAGVSIQQAGAGGANTGAGSGGSNYGNAGGRQGGSGIVIVRY
jgi:hypothetical protein